MLKQQRLNYTTMKAKDMCNGVARRFMIYMSLAYKCNKCRLAFIVNCKVKVKICAKRPMTLSVRSECASLYAEAGPGYMSVSTHLCS